MREGLTKRMVCGSLVRVCARLLAIIVALLYLLFAAVYAIGGAHGAYAAVARSRLDRLTLSDYSATDILTWIALAIGELSILAGAALCLLGLYISFLMDRFGRSLHARGAKDVLATDERPHILYLRNFGDDRIRMMIMSELSARGSLAEYNVFRRTRFEEVVVQRLNRYGPVIAVNDPRRLMPALGSAKLSLPNDTWFETVTELSKSALAVVVSAAPKTLKEWFKGRNKAARKRIGAPTNCSCVPARAIT